MQRESLKTKTVKGVGWSAIDAFVGQGITFLVGIILARLLSPAEYGLIGICTIFITVLTSIVDSGFSNALIRKRDTTSDDYNTMFIANMATSILMYIVLFVIAPWIAAFFKRPELTELVQAMGWILIIQALSITQVTILTKQIDFKTKAKASLISSVISGIIGISMASSGFGAWALVGQQLSNKTLYTFSLWVFNKWCPHLRFSMKSFCYMWGFGWKLMLSGLLNNVWNQLYQVVVGKCYSPATLGQYSRSHEYGSLFSSNFTGIIQRVAFPILAEIQDDNPRMVTAYRKIIKESMFIAAICMISMGGLSEPLVYCLIGPQWYLAATFLPFICFSMSFFPLHAINLNMLQVQGRSDIFLELEIIKKIIAVGPLLLGVFVGIYWMLIGSIFTGFISIFLNTYYTGKKLGYTAWMQLKDIAPSYGLAFTIAITIYFLKYIAVSPWIILLTQIAIGIGEFFLICEFTKMEEYIELKKIVIIAMNKIRNRKH